MIKKSIWEYIYKSKKINNQQIGINYRSYSGSNSYCLYKLTPEYIEKKYDIVLFKEINIPVRKLLEEKNYKTLFHNFKEIKKIYSSKILITTHGAILKRRKNITIDLWHGFPLKTIGLMDTSELNRKKIVSNYKKIDYMTSYSRMYTTLMVASTGIMPEKFLVTGMPRNDFLFHSNGLKNLKKIFNDSSIEKKKIIFFTPTFRKNDKLAKQKNINNIFGIENFEIKEFYKFLKINNFLLIAKLHPNDEKKIYIENTNTENFKLLKNTDLEKYEIDLYETLNAADLLITDYSSIYFDYLLLDKPIIFVVPDIKEYREKRGFLLEPYNYWTPGKKVVTTKDLECAIIESFANDKYKEKRNELKNLIHYYKDGNSSQRIWKLIDKLLMG